MELIHQPSFFTTAALDLGGTLIKCVLVSKENDTNETILEPIDDLALFLDHLSSIPGLRHICLTGGGSVKFKSLIEQKLSGIILSFLDEMACIAEGTLQSLHVLNHPIILINAGSGVSILKISPDGTHRRVFGTCIGGGTFHGMSRNLFGDRITIEEALKICSSGVSNNVDMLVGDIYGESYTAQSLDSSLVASSLGKLYSSSEKKDLGSAFLKMVVINICQTAVLSAKLEGVSRIIFSGGFVAFPEGISFIIYHLKFLNS